MEGRLEGNQFRRKIIVNKVVCELGNTETQFG